MNGLTLEGSLADLGLNIEQIKAMDYFLNELLRWNRVHNLTAIEDTDSAMLRETKHRNFSLLTWAPEAASRGSRLLFCKPNGAFI